MFSKNIRTIYLYLVCLITLFMVIGGLIFTINSITEYIFPDNYRDYYYDYIDESFENGKVSVEDYEKYIELNKYQDQLKQKNRQREQLKEIIYSASVFIVALPIYLYNWRKIEKDRFVEETVQRLENEEETIFNVEKPK